MLYKFFKSLFEKLFTDINKDDYPQIKYGFMNRPYVSPPKYISLDDLGNKNFKHIKSIFRNDLNEKTQEK